MLSLSALLRPCLTTQVSTQSNQRGDFYPEKSIERERCKEVPEKCIDLCGITKVNGGAAGRGGDQ